mmetsp:Transcript_3867/g.9465  ORF Transcript_3867/g.9465 Transcript_3867/m.9465 type:complete len:390 (-) Transcript_3867:101-1270(-)
MTTLVCDVSEELTCPVCLDLIRDCHATPCQHYFCRACITMCLQRRRSCPVCFADVREHQLQPCALSDRITETLRGHNKQADSNRFKAILDANSTHQDVARTGRSLTPLENVLRKHVMASLAAYEDYLQSILQEYEKEQRRIEEDFSLELTSLASHMRALSVEGGNDSEQDALFDQQVDLQRKKECALAQLAQQRDDVERDVVQAFDRHLQTHLVDGLADVGIVVTLAVPARGLQYPCVELRCADTLATVLDRLLACMRADGKEIVSHGDAVFELIRPFQTVPRRKQSVTVLSSSQATLGSLHVITGATLSFIGTMYLKEDVHDRCFSKVFDGGKKQRMDYFSCRDCKLTWICSVCARACHQGHQVDTYITGHVPTWACCYCMRSKRCVA